MTTHDAILCSILSAPDDDLPRLVYADFLEESGDAARAAHIRTMVEFDRIPECGHDWALQEAGDCPRCDQRTAIYKATTDEDGNAPWCGMLVKWAGALGSYEVEWSRGFITSVRIPWQDFLRIHESLIWSPTQTVECPKCKGGGRAPFANEWQCWTCGKEGKRGASSGRIPRPFVATAQPVREVALTTWPVEGLMAELIPGANHFMMPGTRYSFDRVKCGACDGWHLNRRVHECKECGGIYRNEWTCDRWPGVTFRMPEASHRRRMTDEERYHYGDIPLATTGSR